MNNLEFLNENKSIDAVDRFYESRYKNRTYLGLSECGHPCKRYIWYVYNNLKKPVPKGRILRLFQLGNLIETQVYLDLVSSGFTVFDMQQKVKFTQGNLNLVGHIDGKIKGLLESSKDHLWECKSIGSKGWAKLLKEGYEKYSEQYKWQLQFYMLGTGLKRAFVTVYNKDTSELYQERVKLRRKETIKKLNQVFEIIESKTCPEKKLCPRQDYYLAKFCSFKEVCWRN